MTPDLTPLPSAGSNRQYFRTTDSAGRSVILCRGTSRDENDTFIYLAQHFAARGLPMPRVYSVSDDHMSYTQEDLGNTSLYDALRQGRTTGGQYDSHERALLTAAVSTLPRLQLLGAIDLDFARCPQPPFGRESIFFDLNYFKYCFLKPSNIEFDEHLLEHAFNALADSLLAVSHPQGFLYRDFQARNIMLVPGYNPDAPADALRFIDFQGGRQGPIYYDLASFIYQASAHYSDTLRRELADDYYTALQPLLPPGESIPRDTFHHRVTLFALLRTLQVLGAYGYRGLFERKQYFIDSIPHALDNLRTLLHELRDTLPPYLHTILCQLSA